MRIKFILSLVFAMVFAMPVMSQNSEGCAILTHNGIERFYKAADLQKAFDDAFDGDSIILAEGNYYNDKGFTITKKLYIRGTLDYTKINSDVTLNISGDSKFDSPLFDCVRVLNLFVESNIDYLILRRCSGDLFINDDCVVTAYMNRCSFGDVKFTGQCNSWVMQNSYIGNIYGTHGVENMPTLINCEYYCFGRAANIPAKFINCIIGAYGIYDPKISIKNSIFEYCLVNSKNIEIDESSTVIGKLYSITSDKWNVDVNNLTAMQCFGNDGTIVGYNGGQYPMYRIDLNGAPYQWISKYILSGRKFSVEFLINP